MAAGAARIPPAKSISATCSTPGAATCWAIPPPQRRSPDMKAAARRPSPAPLSREQCEEFLIHEARLLDDGRFDEWLALFTADARYWVPSEPNQKSPLDTVSLMYDDRRLLETRVRTLASPSISSQEQ